MALPKLNAVPKYDMVIPSTGKSVRFRPFLVKEEKILMLAAESEDPKQMANALADMFLACVQEDIDKNTLTATDVEYGFLKIRAKSVGETTTLKMTCTNCEHDNEVKVNLDEVEVPKAGKLKERVELEKNLFIELQQPTFSGVLNATNSEDENLTTIDKIFDIISEAITNIITENENINARDVSKAELREFLESMSGEQFAKVRAFVEQLPRLQKEIKFKCESCGYDNKTTVEGIQAFLS